jgi:aspartate carbamoyltransferase catalytic subunit
MGWTRKHLLTIRELEAAEILTLIDTAASLQEIAGREIKKVPALRGKTVVNLFYENSTRTRTSFEIAGKWLSADVINFSASGSSAAKGESFVDTARNIGAMSPDVVVVRHSASGAAALLAREMPCSIVNAGDGAHEHPTQALLDALTLRERLGSVEGRVISIVGDIAHSRVARSNIHCLFKLGARVRVAGPSTLIPVGIERLGCEVKRTLAEALRGADAVMTLRIQQERIADARIPGSRDYARVWGLDVRALELLPPGAVVLHPGPVNRGVELTSDVLESERSLVMDQVDSGVAVRMAALALCLGAA